MQSIEVPEEKEEVFVVTRDTIIGDIIRKYPFAIEIFMDYGIHCVGCHVSDFESIGQGVLGHGFSEGELLDIIEEINEMIQNPPADDEFADIPV